MFVYQLTKAQLIDKQGGTHIYTIMLNKNRSWNIMKIYKGFENETISNLMW